MKSPPVYSKSFEYPSMLCCYSHHQSHLRGFHDRSIQVSSLIVYSFDLLVATDTQSDFALIKHPICHLVISACSGVQHFSTFFRLSNFECSLLGSMESGSPFTRDGLPTGVLTSSASILDNSPLALLNNSSELRISSDWKNASRLTFMYTSCSVLDLRM
jgi:hypothetical protein